MLSKGGEDVTDRLFQFRCVVSVSCPFPCCPFLYSFRYRFFCRFLLFRYSLAPCLALSLPPCLGAKLIRSLDVCFAPGHSQHTHAHTHTHATQSFDTVCYELSRFLTIVVHFVHSTCASPQRTHTRSRPFRPHPHPHTPVCIVLSIPSRT